jgi:DnaJ-class molecular chaperone
MISGVRQNGDAYAGKIVFTIIEQLHSQFQRVGDDLYCSCSISFQDALCGTTFQIQHLNHSVITIDVPELSMLACKPVEHILW